MATKQKKTLFGYFPAKLLPPLRPIVDHARSMEDDRFALGSLFMEPGPDGGAFVGAISGHAMIVFYSEDATCNGPMTMDMPDACFDAAEHPAPQCYDYCGEHYSIEMPEWMQPGTVYATDTGTFVLPKMRAPCWSEEHDEFQPTLFQMTASVSSHYVGIDYTASEGVVIDWRKPLIKASTEAQSPAFRSMAANPYIVSLFDPLFQMTIGESENAPPLIFHRPTGTPDAPGAILVTIEGRPDIVATYMGLSAKASEPPNIPWSFLKPASAAAGAGHV